MLQSVSPLPSIFGYLARRVKRRKTQLKKHEHARPLNKRCAWRLTTGFAFIKMARLKAIIALILLVGLGECARELTKCVVYKKKNPNMVLTKAKSPALTYTSFHLPT